MKKSPFKMLTLATAGACLLTLSVPLASAQDAASPEPVAIVPISAQLDPGSEPVTAVPISAQLDPSNGPVTAVPISAEIPNAQTVTVTKKQLEVDFPADVIKVTIELPVISGMTDASYQEKLNKAIEKTALADLESMKKPAAEDKASAEQYDYPFRQHELYVSYEVKSDGNADSGNVLSILVNTYMYTGGAHGMTRVDSYNAQTNAEASTLTLKQALGEGGLKKANNAVYQQILKNRDNYYTDVFDIFKGISAEMPFFMENGTVNLVFQQYEIAPYASGVNYVAVTDKAGAIGTVTLTPAGPANARLVPLRQAAEALGYKIVWNNRTQSVELSRGAQWTSVTVGKNSYFANKMAPVKLSAAPTVIKGTVYVPVHFFDSILKLRVIANDSGSITISG
ncbi:PdaC/SigV domain-containing protein [Paenibacillus kobensis]|uniref:PdaC/SigV domain-containing protein n=1 Tax=Paenibacillus kobensis TaxID=59841 RepID=UPI000FDB0389|nr:DUF4163 domain-containing protein [Paenibacillus kobensis]